MKIGIYGYGNLGRGVELAIAQNEDMVLTGIFTRRPKESISAATDVPVYQKDDLPRFKSQIDILILCDGSASDLPATTPTLAREFDVIDSFDTHASIAPHFAATDRAAKETGHIALISAGWDPGLFSLARLYAHAFLPRGSTYTFWGRGVSQGHSDAIRQIKGVRDARQYTVPVSSAIEAVRSGQMPVLSPAEMHRRECYVVAEEGADHARIESEIKAMPHYFAGYETSVTFQTAEEFAAAHHGMPHGGRVICNGRTGDGAVQTLEFRLSLGSNPAFTGSVLLAYARALHRMKTRGEVGCKTVFDIAPADLSFLSAEELLCEML